MSNYDYNLRIQALRRSATVIGVVGMAASGKTEFDTVVRQLGYTIFNYDREGIMEDTFLPIPEITLLPPEHQAEILTWNKLNFDSRYSKLVVYMSQNYTTYETIKNVMFDVHMNFISEDIKTMSTYSFFLKSNNVVFVQCPLSTKFKYNDMIDAMITISRPKTYETSWWVNNYVDGMTPKCSIEDAITTMKYNDTMFDKARIVEVAANINNNSNLDTFKLNCKNTIESVVEVLMSR
jgi:uridine kinase